MSMYMQEARRRARVVALYSSRVREPHHEQATHAEIARRLARMQGLEFAGRYDPARHASGGTYFVPSTTIIGLHEARNMNITDESDLFGGVVPEPFMATKAVTHPLVTADAQAPAGWSASFGHRVQDAVLPGISVFSMADAIAAGARLLQRGPVRIKPVLATAGRGQRVAHNADEIGSILASLDVADMSVNGLVLELNLEDVVTYSVGQVRVAGMTATYYGTQQLTTDHTGETVYGGSTLTVARGGFDELLALDLPETARRAIRQARIYDAAASDCFAGLIASRRNYDIAEGMDARGHRHCGVLEQSWRIGGASSAEVLALEAFSKEPSLRYVRSRSLEFYDEDRKPPADAVILYRGQDDDVGFITKCAYIESHGNP